MRSASDDHAPEQLSFCKMFVRSGDPAKVLATLVETLDGQRQRILTHLWQSGFPTVAACDYEAELPWRGGIARLDG